jgi:hypothetical protein
MEHFADKRSPFSAHDLAILDAAAFDALASSEDRLLSDAQARYLLAFALLAPSSHNTVPTAYRLGGDSLAVYLRKEFVLAASDPTGEEALISVGCAVEAFVIAAARYGLDARWQAARLLRRADVLPSSAGAPVHVGTLALSRRDAPAAVNPRTLEALIERQVVRAEYDRSLELPQATALALEAAVGAVPGARLDLFPAPAQKFAWAKLEETALKHKLEEAPFRSELGEWLLSNHDATSTRGMRGHEFGLDDSATALLRAELRGYEPLESDRLANLARGSRLGLVSSSAVGVLSTPDDGAEGAVSVGRAFERAAVALAEHGFCCAVHTAVCQVPHVRAMAQATLLGGTPPKLVFRAGKPLNPEHARRPFSSRPPLEELLLPPGPADALPEHRACNA